MLYNVVIIYEYDGKIKKFDLTAVTREICENRAIRFICANDIKVISITFTEEK